MIDSAHTCSTCSGASANPALDPRKVVEANAKAVHTAPKVKAAEVQTARPIQEAGNLKGLMVNRLV